MANPQLCRRSSELLAVLLLFAPLAVRAADRSDLLIDVGRGTLPIIISAPTAERPMCRECQAA